MAKPRADLGAMVVTKGDAAQAVPHQPSVPSQSHVPPTASQQRGAPEAVKALTVKVPDSFYWRLRDLCDERGRATGRRPTHQEIMMEGLAAILEKAGR
jgi:hypothetical protein